MVINGVALQTDDRDVMIMVSYDHYVKHGRFGSITGESGGCPRTHLIPNWSNYYQGDQTILKLFFGKFAP